MPDEVAPVVRPIRPPPWDALAPLIAESAAEGFRFLLPLRADYDAGRVRFDGPGETLLGVYAGDELIAIGALTRDPYAGDPRTGRVRRVYVRPAHRRRGVGRQVLAALEAAARAHFDVLLLRTDTVAAARFYERLGFAPLPPGGTATHRRALRESTARTA